jgi:Protein of unknown function (DUF2794)
MSTLVRLADHRRKHKRIFFTRPELHQLLSLYSRQVMRGEWRDYAIDQHDTAVVFSVYRHTQDSPLFTVVKAAPGTGRQGDYALLQGRRRLASGASLSDVLPRLVHALGPIAVPCDGETAG